MHIDSLLTSANTNRLVESLDRIIITDRTNGYAMDKTKLNGAIFHLFLNSCLVLLSERKIDYD